MDKPTVDLAVEFKYESDGDPGAILIFDGDREAWIPKSLLVDFEENYHQKGDMIEIEVYEWFAEKEELL